MKIPERSSLVTQVTEILRRGIHHGEWTERLPSEVALCERLQVSRKTLRAALAVLQRERFFKVRYGKGRDICAPSKRRSCPVSRVIGVWYTPPAPIVTAAGDAALNALRIQLEAAGYEMAVVNVAPNRRGFRSAEQWRNVVAQHNAACWLIRSAPVEVQRWFMERKIPAIVAGTRNPEIHLPAFDFDFRAVCRHAARVFQKLGHRHVVLLSPRTDFGGDRLSALGFSETLPKADAAERVSRVAYHDGTVEGVCRVLDGLLRLDRPPTGILVSRSVHALTVFSYLLKSGKALPQDLSLISRDDDEFLGAVTPSIARYVSNWNVHAKRLARAVLRLARTGTLAPRQILLFPQFHKGETLAPPKS